ncbi:response regulator [Herpetosiphon giganteus]|uniref:response regulator n=1 Tax=Herpetosiphon giganteus TaxID=2029754 RepID=UPI0019561F00|nr:response regulator transcription factor [Herpetosiphon giganteus]MBM7845177.1 DNA-binding NarL/FixJ family response regulator [Herpetosiphon giganteus]
MIRVLLADDHLLLRQGTKALLATADDIEIVAESGEGGEVIEFIQRLKPDIILLDIRLQGMSGIEVARAIRGLMLDTKILILSGYHYEQYVRTLFAVGVHGYMLKDASGPELIASIRAVCRGETVLSAEISAHLVAKNHRFGLAANEELSDREREVLTQVAYGASNKEIAAVLNISIRTIETHVSNVMVKLRARSRTDAVNLAIQLGIIVLEYPSFNTGYKGTSNG